MRLSNNDANVEVCKWLENEGITGQGKQNKKESKPKD